MVKLKNASNADNFEAAVKGDPRLQKHSPAIAVQVLEGTNPAQLMGMLLNNFHPSATAGKSILVVDQNGKVLIPMQPFPIKGK